VIKEGSGPYEILIKRLNFASVNPYTTMNTKGFVGKIVPFEPKLSFLGLF
jgi:hypothetical protein